MNIHENVNLFNLLYFMERNIVDLNLCEDIVTMRQQSYNKKLIIKS